MADRLRAPTAPIIHQFAVLLVVVAPLLGCVNAIAFAWAYGWINWFYLTMMFVGYVLTGVGISLGYHRLLSHRAFETYWWVRAILMFLGSLGFEKGPLEWCAVHRKHHALSDLDGDPHSPRLHGDGFLNAVRGWWYAHAGWIFTGHLLMTDHKRYVPDLLKDRFAVWLHRNWEGVCVPLTFLIPAVIGGVVAGNWTGAWLGFLWGGLVRIFLVNHVTWSINSICHLFGRQDYEVSDSSRNLALFSLISFGDSWHNNHHAFPSSARHGFHWWQVDPNWMIVRALELLGLAWNVQRPTAKEMEKRTLATSTDEEKFDLPNSLSALTPRVESVPVDEVV